MRKIALLAAIALTAVSFAAAESSDDPTEVYKDAKVGLYLPADTQTTVDTGTWIAVSAEDNLTVMFEKFTKTYSEKELTEKNVTKACVDYGVKGFKFLDSRSDEGLVYAYGRGKYKTNAGTEYEGYFGLLVNADVKKKTFFFGYLVPSLKDKDVNAMVLDIVDNMVPME